MLLCIPVYTQTMQDNLVFNEQFENNANKWLLGSTDIRNTEISGGKYIMQLLLSNKTHGFWNSPSFTMNQEYKIEAEIRKTSGDDVTDAYGIMYGIKDYNNCCRFLLRADGKATVVTVINGTAKNNLEWTEFACVNKGLSSSNILTIERRNAAVVFKVNGTRVYSMDETTYSGTSVGFYLEGKSTLEAEYITISQRNFSPINLLKTSIPFGERKNLGTTVNSEYDDICPVIAPDGKTLYFGKYEPLDPSNTNNTSEQIWFSNIEPDGTWGKAIKAAAPLNNATHCFVISVAPDNNTMMVANAYNNDGTSAGRGVSISNKTATGWTVPKKITIKNEYNRNIGLQFCTG